MFMPMWLSNRIIGFMHMLMVSSAKLIDPPTPHIAELIDPVEQITPYWKVKD
jgi:hypothetical protein